MKFLLPIYRDPEILQVVYKWWYEYVEPVPNRGNWVIDADAKYSLRGWFKRMTSTPDRGMWVLNADANHGLPNGATSREVMTRIGSRKIHSQQISTTVGA